MQLTLYFVRSKAFAATGFNKIFSGDQPYQMNKRNRRFEEHLGLHHQGSHFIDTVLLNKVREVGKLVFPELMPTLNIIT
jgi:hypothetical protein